MNKRSAMTIAAGLVFALMVGAAAVAMGGTGPDVGSNEAQAAQKPHVRTVTRTVKVQRASDDLAAPGATVTTTQGASSSQGSSDDDRWDDHGDDDLWDDHGDDDDHDGWDDHGGEDDDDHGVDD